MNGRLFDRIQVRYSLIMKTKSTFRIGRYLAAPCMLAASVGAQPNILLITADDLGWDSLGVHGCPVAETTPNLDRLAQEGSRFEHAYVSIALCTPSRQAMLSGNYSHQTMTHGFTELERKGPAMPDLLKQHGYYLANINKQADYYEWDTAIGEDASAMGRDVPFYYTAISDIIAQAAKKQQPWFIMANSNDPHRPFYNSESELKNPKYTAFREAKRLSTPSRVYSPDEISVPGFLPDLPEIRQDMAEYYSSVRRLDDSVGRILAAVEDAGQTTNTLVIFMSDNGISVPYSKMNCYRASLRTPMILRWPGRIPANYRDPRNMVSGVDLAPTLFEFAGIDIPPHMAGRSFAPLLAGKSQPDRDYIVGHHYRNLRSNQMYPEFTIQSLDWVYIYNPWVDGKTEVHNSDYTGSTTLLAMWDAAEKIPSVRERVNFHKYRVIQELYNVRQDPYAYHNVIDNPENAEQAALMRQKLLTWMKDTDHPAAKLMADPLNPTLIAEYMALEKATATEEDAELDELNKQMREKTKK
ncbi:MAG: sulfatase [Kiritimatiellaceae bacterium]|nr:sulfatase [Kiritimatiellaceae bacterium]